MQFVHGCVRYLHLTFCFLVGTFLKWLLSVKVCTSLFAVCVSGMLVQNCLEIILISFIGTELYIYCNYMCAAF